MANVKITDLTAYTDPLNTDVLAIVDVTNNVTKKVSIANMAKNVSLGTAALPGVAFDGDPNTGIYSPGADELAVSTNGTQRLAISSTGAVTIPGTLGVTGAITGALTGAASSNVLKAGDTMTGALAVTAGTAALPGIAVSGDLNTGIFSPGADTLALVTGGTNRLHVTSAGLVGIGTSSPSERLSVAGNIDLPNVNTFIKGGGHNVVQVDATRTYFYGGTSGVQLRTADNASELINITNAGLVGIGTTAPSSQFSVGGASGGANPTISFDYTNDNTSKASISANHTSGEVRYSAATSYFPTFYSSGSERVRLDTSGRLLVGTSSAPTASVLNPSKLVVAGNTANTGAGTITLARGSAVTVADQFAGEIFFTDSAEKYFARIAAECDGTPGTNDYPGRLVFSTTADGASSPTERMTIKNDGRILIGKTATAFATSGTEFPAAGGMDATRAGILLSLNRITTDGSLVDFYQDTALEGSISVSGTTVSYNGAHLSRWSQLPSGAERTEILRGSVLSNIDEMCEWTDEENEQLNRMKVSDVEGDKNVSGVFQAWDDDDDTYTDDFYCAMTGDFIIRIAEGVTVERGDLLMSAGDGTAKPQADDIIRSKTIAKVTSTNVSCTYADGSYCVPCVLMAC